MQTTTLGRTGLTVSRLGFGAAPIGFLNTDQQRVQRIIQQLMDGGVNLIDTAAAYEGSEEAVGKAIAGRRDQLVLVSKCGQSFPDLPGESWSAQAIGATIDRSLQRLKTDRLDVLLLHSCPLDVLQNGEALGALVKARQAGKIRFAGYSGDNEAGAWAAAQPDVAVIETSINICDQQNLDQVLPVCREHEVGVLAKRPIANACWKDLDKQPGMYQSYAADYTKRFQSMGLTPAGLGFKGEADWPEIALRFTLSQPGVHTAIIGTTNPDNAAANLAAADRGPLTSKVITEIRNTFRQAAQAHPDQWIGLT